MDKETLRIIIFLIGVLTVIGMIAWSFLQHQKDERDFKAFDETKTDGKSPSTEKNHTFDVISSVLKKTSEMITDPLKNPASSTQKVRLSPPPSLDLFQLSIISPTDKGFSGEDIFSILDNVGLKYGNLQIFERIDGNNMVDFAVANIVNPGVFPKGDLKDFSCPGLSFFMQPKQVSHPSEVFEDFIRTLNFVALKLEGEMKDHLHHPLTDEYLQQIRQDLSKMG
ncbi:MAG: cell division protein ZipA C-terminal FtsZ-binding domain-containing protein [Methylococcales bacterium]|nr:cell division protein ZipA C-terminal FtsZ-binding domain-containing protein [Methylococcales bacterium]